jgi:hypothetical protein
MQDTKSFEDQHPVVGPGLSGALGSLRKGGERKTGVRPRRIRRDAKITGEKVEVKTKCGEVKGRLG